MQLSVRFSGRPSFRRAALSDLDVLLALMSDTAIDPRREQGASRSDYERAFAAIEADPNQFLAVAEASDHGIIGTMQLSFLPGLSRKGMWRLQLENVRIRGDLRGQGLGRQFLEWAYEEGRKRGCGLVQLTTHVSRADAQRFYLANGFEPTHLGMKRTL